MLNFWPTLKNNLFFDIIFCMNEQLVIIIGWCLTGAVAIGGWIVAGVLSAKNRKLEQKKMRHDTYRSFMVELDEMAKDIAFPPMETMKKIWPKCLSAVLSIDYNQPDHEQKVNESIISMTQELWDCVEHASKPLLRISHSVAALELDASEELLPLLQELKTLIEEFNKEWQQALGTFSQDLTGLQKLTTIGQNGKWERFRELQASIIQQMRKEISI